MSAAGFAFAFALRAAFNVLEVAIRNDFEPGEIDQQEGVVLNALVNWEKQ